MAEPRRSAVPWLNRSVVAIGLVSLFTDAASEMVLPLLPVFLTTVLGAGVLAVGWLEGLAEATASILKLFAGGWADRTGRRRPFMLAGYGLSSVVRPLVALASTPAHVIAVRVIDRVGKGVRSSPRDALLADAVPEIARGLAFGFHRGMDHAGAVLGPLVAVAVLTLWTTDLRTLFWLAAIPGAFAVLAIIFGVREHRSAPRSGARLSFALPNPERRALLRLLVPLGVFTLGNASDLFLLLYAGGHDVPLAGLPLLWVGLHVVKSLVSPLGGWLGDRIGYVRTVALGWLVYVATYVLFGFVRDPWLIAVLFMFYGLYHGLTEGPEKAFVAAAVPPTFRGTAFGWYHLVVGLLALPASLLFALLWEVYDPATAFFTGAGLAAVATMLLWTMAGMRNA